MYRCCDVCEERKRLSELQKPKQSKPKVPPKPGGKRKASGAAAHPHGAHLINVKTEKELAVASPYLLFWGPFFTSCLLFILLHFVTLSRSRELDDMQKVLQQIEATRSQALQDQCGALPPLPRGLLQNRQQRRLFTNNNFIQTLTSPHFAADPPSLPSVPEEGLTIPNFPRLSIFNGCILAPTPPQMKLLIEKGCYHLNFVKMVTYPLSSYAAIH